MVLEKKISLTVLMGVMFPVLCQAADPFVMECSLKNGKILGLNVNNKEACIWDCAEDPKDAAQNRALCQMFNGIPGTVYYNRSKFRAQHGEQPYIYRIRPAAGNELD